MQKEFIERQSDKQVDLLIQDACERCKRASEEALPRGLSGLKFYNQRKVGEGKRPPSLSRRQAYITSSSFVLGRRVSDPMRSDCHSAYSNQ